MSYLSIKSDGIIQFASPYAENILEYEIGELVGKHVGILIPENLREIHDEHLKAFFNAPILRPLITGAHRDVFALTKTGKMKQIEAALIPTDIDKCTAIIVDTTFSRVNKSLSEIRDAMDKLIKLLSVVI